MVGKPKLVKQFWIVIFVKNQKFQQQKSKISKKESKNFKKNLKFPKNLTFPKKNQKIAKKSKI